METKVSLKYFVNSCRTDNWHLLDSHQILKTFENQELINAMIKDAKYFKII